MANILDVAQYITDRLGPTQCWKLHRLVFFAQASYIRMTNKRLFKNRIEAWAGGPTSTDLYKQTKLQITILDINGGKANRLSQKQKAHIDTIIETYSDFVARVINEISREDPAWIKTRAGLQFDERSHRKITMQTIRETATGDHHKTPAKPTSNATTATTASAS